MPFSIELLSPNFLSRNNNPIDCLILKSIQDSAKNIIDIFSHPNSEHSSHYLIDEKGVIYNIVSEKKAAIGIKNGFWRNIPDIDLRSIYITIATKDSGTINETQKNTLFELCTELIEKYKIPATNVISACDASFVSNHDAGFPWQEMAIHGIGLWTNEIEEPNEHSNLLEILTDIGYQINIQNYRLAIIAFQKHFLPDNISGEQDTKTIKKALAVKTLYK